MEKKRTVNKTYDLLRLEKKHLHDLQSVIYQSFKKKLSYTFLEKKYDSSAYGVRSVATIAYDGQKAIGFYGAIPQLFQGREKSIWIAHTCDSYTIPSYQRQGLHYQLARKSYELMQAQGIKIVYAYHSENTYYSTKKLDWEEHVTMKRFHLYPKTFPIARAANKLHLNKALGPYIRQVLKPYLAEPLENPLLKEGKICNTYDSRYYSYKEGFNEHFSIELKGCHFYLKIKAIMHIGWFDYPDVSALKQAINQLIRLGQRIGVNELMFQVAPDTRQYKGLAQLYESHDSWLIGYLCLDAPLPIQDFGFNYGDLDTF